MLAKDVRFLLHLLKGFLLFTLVLILRDTLVLKRHVRCQLIQLKYPIHDVVDVGVVDNGLLDLFILSKELLPVFEQVVANVYRFFKFIDVHFEVEHAHGTYESIKARVVEGERLV